MLNIWMCFDGAHGAAFEPPLRQTMARGAFSRSVGF
jgi:hypothetical protein